MTAPVLAQSYSEQTLGVSDFATSIVDTVAGPLVVVDEQMRTRLVNNAFCRLFQVQREESVDQPLLELGNGQWNIPALESVLRTVISERGIVEDFEVEHEFPHIGHRIMSLSARELTSSDGAGRMILLAIVDITERRQTESALAWHTREVERSNRELVEFAYVASHDLQEPLRKIRAYASLMVADCGASLDAAARDYLDRMVNASGRMQTLITDILLLSRVGAGTRQLARVSLSQIVSEVLVDLEIGITESKADVLVGALPTIEADSGQMRQLFQNLISNAIKFGRVGVVPRVKITSALAPAQETLGILSPPVHEITITDNGIGFEARHSEIIFGAFQRLHARGTYIGTGMGLTICRKIVECHGGTITATSTPGSGSEFHIMLPARQLHAR